MADELFRSDDLLVRRVSGFGGACCVVTFDSFTDFRTLDRLGFGQIFLEHAGIDAIHVIPRDNLWYQHAEMADAMAAVRAVTAGYRRVVTYGSSMGAYAAIRLAGLAGANAVLALSPQYSIDPAIAPWESRFPVNSAEFRGVWERTLPYPVIAEAYVGYDPLNPLDKRHAALLAKRFRFQRLELPTVGHPVTGFLADIGLLQRGILELCRGTFDRPAYVAEARARRRESPQHLLTMADLTAPWRRRRRLELLREAVRLSPENALLRARLGAELRYLGRYEESLAQYRLSVEKAPTHPNILLQYSLALQRMGDLGAALAVMEEVNAVSGEAAIYRPRLETLRAMVASGVVEKPQKGAWPWFARWARD